jgi:hypothetical protein
MQCKDPAVQKIYDAVMSSSFQHNIVNSQIARTNDGDDLVSFTLRLTSEREHEVTVTILQPIEGVTDRRNLIVFSFIGNLKEVTADKLLKALAIISKVPFVRLQLGDDCDADLVYVTDLELVNIPYIVNIVAVMVSMADSVQGTCWFTDDNN